MSVFTSKYLLITFQMNEIGFVRILICIGCILVVKCQGKHPKFGLRLHRFEVSLFYKFWPTKIKHVYTL